MSHYDCQYCGGERRKYCCKEKTLSDNFDFLDLSIRQSAKFKALELLETQIEKAKREFYLKGRKRLFDELYRQYFKQECYFSISDDMWIEGFYEQDGDRVRLFKLYE